MRTEFETELIVKRRRVIGLLIFTVAMLAGCIFLIYFLVALWRDGHNQRKGSRVEIIKLPSGRYTNNRTTRLRVRGPDHVLGKADAERVFHTLLDQESKK